MRFGERDNALRSRLGKLSPDGLPVVAWLIGLHVLFLILCIAIRPLAGLLVFSSVDVLSNFTVWQLFTYPLVHGPSLWFVVEMLFLYWFGREVEGFVGRKPFLTLYLVLVLGTSFSGTLVGLVSPVVLAGSGLPHLGVFLLFAFIYPNAEILFRIRAKWIAAVLTGILALQLIAARDGAQLAVLAAACLTAFEIARRSGFGGAVRIAESVTPDATAKPADNHSARAKKKPRHATPPRKKKRRQNHDVDPTDAILEKIARSGLGSLTAREREQLENARKKLLQNDQRSRHFYLSSQIKRGREGYKKS